MVCFRRPFVWLIAALLVVLGLSSSVDPVEAVGQSRTIHLKNMHTKEEITIEYKRNGRFVRPALDKLNWFMRDHRRSESTQMDPRLFDVIYDVKAKLRYRGPAHVVSGYRSLTTNNMLRSRSKGVASRSQHTLGRAMDFYLPGVPVSRIRRAGFELQRGGVGFYPRSNTPFIHLDVGNVRSWPRMTRQQLLAIFPNGETLHLPADGKPLARYEQALKKLGRDGKTGPMRVAQYGPQTVKGVAVANNTGRRGGILAFLFGDGDEDEGSDSDASSLFSRPAVQQDAPVVRADRPSSQPQVESANLQVVAQAPQPSPKPQEFLIAGNLTQQNAPAARGFFQNLKSVAPSRGSVSTGLSAASAALDLQSVQPQLIEGNLAQSGTVHADPARAISTEVALEGTVPQPVQRLQSDNIIFQVASPQDSGVVSGAQVSQDSVPRPRVRMFDVAHLATQRSQDAVQQGSEAVALPPQPVFIQRSSSQPLDLQLSRSQDLTQDEGLQTASVAPKQAEPPVSQKPATSDDHRNMSKTVVLSSLLSPKASLSQAGSQIAGFIQKKSTPSLREARTFSFQ